jgi:hypothetical protein
VGFAVVGLGPLPGLHTVVKAGIASDGSGESVRADGSTHDFNEADGGAVNFGEWGVEDQAFIAEHAETIEEKKQT